MSYFPEDIPFMSKEELRENGIRIPKDVPDTNVGDTISRQAAIARAVPLNLFGREVMIVSVSELENLPSAQPEIIRCRECKFASGDSRICMKFDHSPIGELDFCAWAERRTDE